MDPKGAQMEPRGSKIEPQGFHKCKRTTQCTPRIPKWSPRCYKFNGGPRSPQMQNKHKLKAPKKCNKDMRRCPKVRKNFEKTHKDTNNQPTKETKKTQRNKQSNRHTNKSVELQTQTHKPANQQILECWRGRRQRRQPGNPPPCASETVIPRGICP